MTEITSAAPTGEQFPLPTSQTERYIKRKIRYLVLTSEEFKAFYTNTAKPAQLSGLGAAGKYVTASR